MADMLAAGVAWLQGVRKSNLSQPVTYLRGAFSVPLQATRGQTEFAIETSESVRVESNNFDWIIAASDLILNANATVPSRGDKITDAAGVVYTVMAPAGMQPYKIDQTGQQMRIHTKRTSDIDPNV